MRSLCGGLAVVVWLMMAVLSTVPGAHAVEPDRSVEFTVFRDGLPIGHHRVSVRPDGDRTEVKVDIALDVSFAFIRLYTYRHQSTEVWQGDRLVSLNSWTDDNGTAMRAAIQATPDGLRGTGSRGAVQLPADAVPSSYWSPVLVSGRPLFDSQDGHVLDVSLKPESGGWWTMEGEVRLKLSYSPQGVWSGMRFSLKGSEFDYLPRTMMQAGS